MPRCRDKLKKGCTYKGDLKTFKPNGGVHHDLRCPECGTTAVDTSDVNAQWKAEGRVYGYGDNNTLSFKTG